MGGGFMGLIYILKRQLGLSQDFPSQIRYQLIHRFVSAVIEAKRFSAPWAAMIVHSFSKNDEGFDDYLEFFAFFLRPKVPLTSWHSRGKLRGSTYTPDGRAATRSILKCEMLFPDLLHLWREGNGKVIENRCLGKPAR
jgi:hypothetical protein